MLVPDRPTNVPTRTMFLRSLTGILIKCWLDNFLQASTWFFMIWYNYISNAGSWLDLNFTCNDGTRELGQYLLKCGIWRPISLMGVVPDRTTSLMLIPDRVTSPKLVPDAGTWYNDIHNASTWYDGILMRVPDWRISLMLILNRMGQVNISNACSWLEYISKAGIW